uniref:phenylalanine--tRNA ligase n=2 Tax=Gracilariopsis TaxID=2781 RepID=A0A1C9CF55_9FLOR|nr:phenylalanine tRNA synthetase beta subunit [Gracilariopsis lemaneiformis]YP_009294756.1 phenylalanyl-tRNA synthetase beta chain [Gracilariopsis chorda]AJO68397.1 phenylalanyl-tRNA synthetase beta chain [Gracilariopsis lemaneiformis]AML79928.1 phenylalanine tRNA synthetase beta subunit [Gracilariopsis lemaneiformis]AOM67016.1 phenylalanyl-tRNA synthetase beta chain [Gracilariopsis chorda]
MKFSFKWLKQIVDLKHIELSEVIEKLTLGGCEVENIIYNQDKNDIIFDLSTTANRQDLLSVVGLAREISCLMNRPLLNKVYSDRIYNSNCLNNYGSLNLSNSIALLDFSLTHIKRIRNTFSPLWLQYYLHSQNIKPLNLLHDIPKYIYMKWGHYIEIFDQQKINLLPIQYSLFNIEKEKNLSLQSNSIELEVLKYNSQRLYTLGYDINSNFQCDIITDSVIVCGQIFRSKYFKNIQNSLSIKTDIFEKYNKQVIREDFIRAYEESIRLIISFAGGTIGKSYYYHTVYEKPKVIILEKHKIQNILGYKKNNDDTYLSVKEILGILNQLNFITVYDERKKLFKVQVTSSRQIDLLRPIDIIEEIGRVYGFNRFISQLPKVLNYESLFKNSFTYKVHHVRRVLRNLGLHEIQNISLNNFTISNDQLQISIYNPLIKDQSYLRINLLTQLIITYEYNLRQSNKNVEIFEIGKVFSKDIQTTTKKKLFGIFEHLHLAGLMSNLDYSRKSWLDKPNSLGWFQAKGTLEEFLEKLQARVLWTEINKATYSFLFSSISNSLDIKRAAVIYSTDNKKEIGIFAQLKKNYNYPIYIFEFNLVNLINSMDTSNHINYFIKPYSNYPSLTRDISLTLYKYNSIYMIKQKILDFNNCLIESIEVLNQYRNHHMKHYYNISLRIVYRSYNRTLNIDDISRIDQEINDLLDQYKSI